MLFLCLRFPLLGFDALPPNEKPPADGPAALHDKGRIVLCNAQAQQQGVEAEQSLSTALSIAPGLACVTQQAEAEARHLHNLALWAYRFSGEVSLSPPNGILLELSRSLRLFKSLDQLYRRLVAAFRQRGLVFHTGLAHTPLAAELLSLSNTPVKHTANRQGELKHSALQQLLAALPSHLLPLPPRQLEALDNMGLRRLGDVQRLPLAELRSRFGKALPDLLERMNGRCHDPRPLFTVAEEFHSERQFDGGLHSKEQLRFPVSALLSELESYLQRRLLLNRELHWQLLYLDGNREDWIMPLSHRVFRRRSLIDLVMLGLEQRPLQGPVEMLTLHCKQFLPLNQGSNELFNDEQALLDQQEALTTILDKLRLRLGDDCLQQLHLQNNHLPEFSQQLRVFNPADHSPVSHHPAPPVGLRPSWLLPAPAPLSQRDGQLYYRGALHLLQGPERIDSHWWQQRQVRDYYIAQREDHSLCWLFKDCLSQRWYLHGFFG